MSNPMVDVKSLHGSYFSATIVFYEVMGRILVTKDDKVYLCQDSLDGCAVRRDFLGYKHGWIVFDFDDLNDSYVFNLKILPPPTEYHALLQEILDKRGSVWEEDGEYSVIPNEVLTKIKDFLDGIKKIDNNQNQ